ncbi:hypothetical protein HGB07_10290, partial [Candidatus Roizmanbacteria bacterium]|nr:hypothetical protein [Candidatus Roizmanbacteria bacterium]
MQYKVFIAISLIIVMGITGNFTTLASAQDNIPQTETPTPLTSETVVSDPVELPTDITGEEIGVSPLPVEASPTTEITMVIPEILKKGKYDDRNTKLVFSGNWKQRKVSRTYKSTESYTTEIGSSVTFTFEGTRAFLYFNKNKGYGIATVNIDGTDIAEINQVAKKSYKNKTWISPKLDPAVKHTVTVTLTSGNLFNLDAVYIETKVVPTPTLSISALRALAVNDPLTVGVYDDLDTHLIYSGSWLKHGISKLFLGTESYSTKIGSAVSVSFRGKSVSLLYRKHTFFGDVT